MLASLNHSQGQALDVAAGLTLLVDPAGVPLGTVSPAGVSIPGLTREKASRLCEWVSNQVHRVSHLICLAGWAKWPARRRLGCRFALGTRVFSGIERAAAGGQESVVQAGDPHDLDQ